MYPRSIARGHHSMVSPSLCGSALFGALEPRGLALELAQVEQARTLDLAAAGHLDLLDPRRIERKDALLVAFADLRVHPHGVADAEFGDLSPDFRLDVPLLHQLDRLRAHLRILV